MTEDRTSFSVTVWPWLTSGPSGTTYATKTALDIALDTSREASLAATFNYASMAHNIHFYFETISNKGTEAGAPDKQAIIDEDDEHAIVDKDKTAKEEENAAYRHVPRNLLQNLVMNFGSMENLRREMVEQANAMFGPGFVWLVRLSKAGSYHAQSYKVLTTYQAGTPYPRAHWRMQGTDMNHHAGITDRTGGTINDYFNNLNMYNGRGITHGQSDEGLKLDPLRRGNPGAAEITPVLCVNTWEHAWISDFQVGNKRIFLERWWSAIDWDVVGDRVAKLDSEMPKMSVNPAGFSETAASARSS